MKSNEILRCRMKSKQVWMKSSAHPQMKLNPSFHPAEAGFHREAISPNAVGFIPSQRTDLVEKATKFCRILSLFLGLPERILNLAARGAAGSATARTDMARTSGAPTKDSPPPVGQEKRPRYAGLFFLAYPKGFEPSTFRVGV